ncbi:MAG TPA: right-handed parallel beta-helix repeat-containing protein [Blastocatellia bacterium]|nr:right-handed parallel beta-helix repeat-containing protein [Blastocatellia bacterium]
MSSSNNLFKKLMVGISVGTIVGIVIYIIERSLGMSSAASGGLIGGVVGAVCGALNHRPQSHRANSSVNQLLLAATLLGCAATSASAQATVFVSARNGIDGGACTVAAPCRTVNFALTQTPAGGQVLIVDSGDYDDSIFIDKNVTIAAAPGVAAVFSAAVTFGSIFSFPTSSFCSSAGECRTLVLRNLIFDGQGVTQDAVRGAGLRLIAENCTFTRFRFGVYVNGGGTYQFKNCLFHSLETGLLLAPSTNGLVTRSQANAVVEDCRFTSLTAVGIDASTGPQGFNIVKVVARDSLFNRAGVSIRGNALTGGSVQIDLERCEITNGSTGVISLSAGSIVRVSNSIITGNLTGVSAASSGALLSRTNNTVEANTSNGTFTGTFVAK